MTIAMPVRICWAFATVLSEIRTLSPLGFSICEHHPFGSLSRIINFMNMQDGANATQQYQSISGLTMNLEFRAWAIRVQVAGFGMFRGPKTLNLSSKGYAA